MKMRQMRLGLCLAVIGLMFSANAFAGRKGPNPAVFDFEFGNHIDTHQRTRIDAGADLFGFFYVRFTGETVDGIPVARHCNPDDLRNPSACFAGWLLRGTYVGAATFLYHNQDHPVWLLDRAQIPQPGSYSHFHWLGRPERAHDLVPSEQWPGYMLELQAIETFYFDGPGGTLLRVEPGLDLRTHLNVVTSPPSPIPEGGH